VIPHIVLHVAGPFTGGRQLCTRCGIVLVTVDPDEIGGMADWPPPWAPGPVRVTVGASGPFEWEALSEDDPAGPAFLCPEITAAGPGARLEP
jgi:hypothetical protein